MTIHELKRPQLVELKCDYMAEMAAQGRFMAEIYGEGEERDPSYGEMADADKLVPDKKLFDYYGDIDFSVDDFWDKEGLEVAQCAS